MNIATDALRFLRGYAEERKGRVKLRHKSVDTLRGYTRSFECFRDVCTSSQGLTGVSVSLPLGTGLSRRFFDVAFVP